jgi:hypothetical protein
MGSHDLEHISSIIYRAIEALAEGWEQQKKEREARHEKRRRLLQFDPDSQRYFNDEI